MATAQVLFHRFWYVTSLKQFGIVVSASSSHICWECEPLIDLHLRICNSKDIGMGALYLASKLEECPVRIRDLINVFDLLLARARHNLMSAPSVSFSPSSHSQSQSTTFKYTPMSYFAQEFYDAKDAMVVAEMQILKRLGFNVHVQLPYGTMVNYLQVLGLAGDENVPQSCWDYLNDAYVRSRCFKLYKDGD